MREQLDALTNRHEEAFPHPWRVADAPPDFTEKLLASIAGVEIIITRLSGKWKASQNQPPQNRAGVVAGLNAAGKHEWAAMAMLISERKP